MHQLRTTFDYLVVNAPAAALHRDAAILAMNATLTPAPGVNIDMRTVICAVSAFAIGPVAGLITLAITSFYRISLRYLHAVGVDHFLTAGTTAARCASTIAFAIAA